MFKFDPATAFAANPLAAGGGSGVSGIGVGGGGGGGSRVGGGHRAVSRRTTALVVFLSIFLFVMLIVRQVVYDAAASLSLEDAALLRGRVTGKVFVESEPVSLAVVYPFHAGDIDRVEANLASWGGPGNSPSEACSPRYARHTTLVFYFNFDVKESANRQFEGRLRRAFRPVARCFRRVLFESAKLSPEEDKYPTGRGGYRDWEERGVGFPNFF